MPTPAHQVLREAWKASDRTLADIRRKARLRLSEASLSRILNGKQTPSDAVLEKLATELGVVVEVRHTTVTLGRAA